jgi:hypothetical protein
MPCSAQTLLQRTGNFHRMRERMKEFERQGLCSFLKVMERKKTRCRHGSGLYALFHDEW